MPVLDEAQGIVAHLEPLQALRAEHELIVVDGGSLDDTVCLAEPYVDVVITSSPGRAEQMNAGAAAASNEALLFLHADTVLPADAGDEIIAALQERSWGRFDVSLSGDATIYRIIETMMNLRSRLTSVATGDQAIFVHRAAFDAVAGFPLIPLMEDVAICKRLRGVDNPACLRSRVVTSSRRWEERGVFRTILLMWRLRLLFALGVAPDRLARAYR